LFQEQQIPREFYAVTLTAIPAGPAWVELEEVEELALAAAEAELALLAAELDPAPKFNVIVSFPPPRFSTTCSGALVLLPPLKLIVIGSAAPLEGRLSVTSSPPDALSLMLSTIPAPPLPDELVPELAVEPEAAGR
jgi:hypothetical protein